MPQHSTASSVGAAILIAGAVIGTALAIYNFAIPMTGVNGTIGAVLVVVSSLLLVLDGIILWMRRHGGVFWLFWVLGVLGVVGTAAAGWFLHEWFLIGAMAVVLIGLVLTLFRR